MCTWPQALSVCTFSEVCLSCVYTWCHASDKIYTYQVSPLLFLGKVWKWGYSLNKQEITICTWDATKYWVNPGGRLFVHNTWVLTLLTLMFALFYRNTHAMLIINTPTLINSKKLLVSYNLQMIQTIQVCWKLFLQLTDAHPSAQTIHQVTKRVGFYCVMPVCEHTECPFVCRHAIKSWMEKFSSW